jgi:ribosomal protein L11 methyltransferase
MPWLQVSLTTAKHEAPLIAAVLEKLGALSVSFGDAGDEPQWEPLPGETPLWARVRVTALFPADYARGMLRRHLPADRCAELQFRILEDRPWQRVGLEGLRPMRFGSRLWVCPAGLEAPMPEAVVVELDPGLAFGTGQHATTALCLEWLDAADLAGKTVIDYGCGSGILAVAALRLGAARVWAVDHDPQAWDATAANAGKNGVVERLRVCAPELMPASLADVVLANILAKTLIDLQPTLCALVHPGGDLVLSGILADQAASVMAAYRAHADLDAPRTRDEWVLLHARRR